MRPQRQRRLGSSPPPWQGGTEHELGQQLMGLTTPPPRTPACGGRADGHSIPGTAAGVRMGCFFFLNQHSISCWNRSWVLQDAEINLFVNVVGGCIFACRWSFRKPGGRGTDRRGDRWLPFVFRCRCRGVGRYGE